MLKPLQRRRTLQLGVDRWRMNITLMTIMMMTMMMIMRQVE